MPNLKERIANWLVNNVLMPYHYIDEADLSIAIDDAKDDVWSDTASKQQFEELDYEFDELANNIDDYDNRLYNFEEDVKIIKDNIETVEYDIEEQDNNISDHEDRIDILEEKLKKYDKIFSRIKSINGTLQLIEKVEVVKEEIDEE